MGRSSRVLAASLASAATVVAHGHVDAIVINGVSYPGYDSPAAAYSPDYPPTVGWQISAPDNGFVSPDAFQSADIICHKAAKPALGHAPVKAGDKISIQWNTWPDSHHGPVLDYLANCNGPCESADKAALEFFKIGEGSLISGANPGTWASDTLVGDNFTWLVQIPADVKAGSYVLRHEIIALHSAGQANGAQAYPQCFSLEIAGAGDEAPAGVKGTDLYRADDPGVLFDLYQPTLDYTVPGPSLIAGVPSTVEQSSSQVTSSASAVVGTAAAVTTTAAARVGSPGVVAAATTLATSIAKAAAAGAA